MLDALDLHWHFDYYNYYLMYYNLDRARFKLYVTNLKKQVTLKKITNNLYYVLVVGILVIIIKDFATKLGITKCKV